MTDRESAKKIAKRLFRAKERRRKELAHLPLEKKMEIMANLQKIAREIGKHLTKTHPRG
jgi:hypothetical protein